MIWLLENMLLKWKHEAEALTAKMLQNFYDNFEIFIHTYTCYTFNDVFDKKYNFLASYIYFAITLNIFLIHN